jgi:hypothetical protein
MGTGPVRASVPEIIAPRTHFAWARALDALPSTVTDRRNADRLVWIDCEMTGLEIAHDLIVASP